MNGLILPPELVELIVEDYATLKNCALISWTWVAPCQRALFHHMFLYNSNRVNPLLNHLRRYPHLQNLIRSVAMHGPEPYNDYLSGLIALFPLIPCVTSLNIIFDRSRSWDARDQHFIEAFSAFLHTSKSLTDLVVRNLQDEAELQQMFSYLEGTNVKRVSLYTNRPGGDPGLRVDFFSSTQSAVHLPAIDRLRLGLAYAFPLRSALTFWLCQYPATFPNLKHLEVVISLKPQDVGIWFRDILKPATLQLESFILELMHTMFDRVEELPTNEGLFESLHVKHFHLRTFRRAVRHGLDEARLINWFTSMFRHLANSGTTVHFVDLTFTFMEFDDVGAISAAWAKLDEVLSHSAFRSVQRIRFEDDACNHDERTLITDQAHPELASIIRHTLPRLASRGVLCFA